MAVSERIIVPRGLHRAPAIRPVILGSIRNATPSDGWGGALLLAAALFFAGTAFGWALFHIDVPACAPADRNH